MKYKNTQFKLCANVNTATVKKAAAAVSVLVFLYGQSPAHNNRSNPIEMATSHQEGSHPTGSDTCATFNNTLLSGILIDQDGWMISIPIILKIYLGSKLIAYPVKVNKGLFSVDLKGKALPSDRVTIVMSRQSVHGCKFAKTKSKVLLRNGQNLTVKAETIKHLCSCFEDGGIMHFHEI